MPFTENKIVVQTFSLAGFFYKDEKLANLNIGNLLIKSTVSIAKFYVKIFLYLFNIALSLFVIYVIEPTKT
jgi:hypothetical protein